MTRLIYTIHSCVLHAYCLLTQSIVLPARKELISTFCIDIIILFIYKHGWFQQLESGF